MTWLRKAFDFYCILVRKVLFATASLAALILFLIAVAVVYEVFMRFIIGSPSSWTHEITGYALVWCGFLAAGYTLSVGGHVYVDLLYDRFSSDFARLIDFLVSFAGLVSCLVIMVYGIKLVQVSILTEYTSPTPLRVAMYGPQAAIPVGMAFVSLEFLRRILVLFFEKSRVNSVSRLQSSQEA